MSGKYNFCFPHDFKFTENDLKIIEIQMLEQMDDFLSKLRYLRSRTIDALKGGIAFLFQGDLSQDMFEDLFKHKYNISNYVFFHFPEKSHHVFYHERIVSIPVRSMPWPGHDDSWDNAYRAIDLDLL